MKTISIFILLWIFVLTFSSTGYYESSTLANEKGKEKGNFYYYISPLQSSNQTKLRIQHVNVSGKQKVEFSCTLQGGDNVQNLDYFPIKLKKLDDVAIWKCNNLAHDCNYLRVKIFNVENGGSWRIHYHEISL